MKTYLARMFRYVAWADRRTLAALKASPAAQAEGVPLMAHVLAAEHVWLSRLEQRAPRIPVWPALKLEECAPLVDENESCYRAFIERLGEDQFAGSIRYRNLQGQEFQSTVLEMLTQVITHGPYHRGQIAKIIGRSGGVSVNTDFITFTREAEPAG